MPVQSHAVTYGTEFWVIIHLRMWRKNIMAIPCHQWVDKYRSEHAMFSHLEELKKLMHPKVRSGFEWGYEKLANGELEYLDVEFRLRG